MNSAVHSDFEEIFENIFSSIWCWNAFKICHFLFDAFERVKDTHNKMLKGFYSDTDEQVKFCLKLDEDVIKCELWPKDEEGWGWMAVLGKDFSDLLEKATKNLPFNVVDNLVPDSVVSLMKLIRDLSTHPAVGKTLKWGRYVQVGNEKKWELDKFLFAQFWIDRFPKLPLFIWNAFKSRRSQLPAYYQGNVDFSKTDHLSSPLEFANCLQRACKEQTIAGHLAGRYKMSGTQIVELRPLEATLLGRILDGSAVARIVLKNGKMCFSNKLDRNQQLSYLFPPCNQREMNVEEVTYLFTNDFCDEAACILDGRIFTTKKIVVFMPPNSIERALEHCDKNRRFTAHHLEWKEIENSLKLSLKISVQGRIFLVKSLLKKKDANCEDILCKLRGEELNDLLRSKHLELIDVYTCPTKSDLYVSRRIYNRKIVSSQFFSSSLPNNIFIIINCSLEEREKMSAFTQSISSENVFPELKFDNTFCSVFVVEDEVENFDSEFRSFVGCSLNKSTPVNFFKFTGKDRFEWLNTTGDSSEILTHLKSIREGLGKLPEEEFRKSLNTEQYKNDKVIFVAGEPGMGKSEFAKSLAFELGEDKSEKKAVVMLQMSVFMESLKEKVEPKADENTLKEKVVKTLCELTCTNGFKSKMFPYLVRHGFISLQLIMDALDEVTPSQIPLAWKVIKALRESIPCLQIVVTLREHLLDTVMKEFGQLGYALEPFDEVEQEDFLVSLWCKSLGLKRDEITNDVETELKMFAKECLSKCLSMDNKEIAGIPLQCKIIGEVFKGEVLKKDPKIKDGKYLMSELYEMFLERKFEVLIREKKRWNTEMNDVALQSLCMQLDVDNMALSLILIFPEFVENLQYDFGFLHTDLSDVRKALVMEYGLVTDFSELTFLHRTFAEYLAARFVVKRLESHFEKHKRLDKHNYFRNMDKNLKNFFFECVIRKDGADRFECSQAYLIAFGEFDFNNVGVLEFLDMQLSKTLLKVNIYEDDVQLKYEEYFTEILKGSAAVADIYTHVFTWGLENLNKLLLSFPFYGPLVVLIYGIYEIPEADFDYLVSELDPGPEQWSNLPFLHMHNNGLLHHLIGACVFEQFSPEKVDKVWTYIESVAEKDPTLVKQRNVFGLTPYLHFAQSLACVDHPSEDFEPNWETFLRLVKIKVDFNDVDENGRTFLHILMTGVYGHTTHQLLENVEELLKYVKKFEEQGYSKIIKHANVFDKKGLTPLLTIFSDRPLVYAENEENEVYEKICKIVRAFVECGTNINAADDDGKTVLHQAIMMRNVSALVIICLIENGAKVFKHNGKGQNAAEIARDYHNKQVYEFLREKNPAALDLGDIE